MKQLVIFLSIFLAFSLSAAHASDSYPKALHLIKVGYIGDAVSMLRGLSSDNSYVLNDYAQYKIASMYDESAQYGIAEAEYLKVPELFPYSALSGKAYIRVAEINFNAADYMKAAFYYDQAVKYGKVDSYKDYARYRAGICYENAGLLEGAADRYSQVEIYHPLSAYIKDSRVRLEKTGFSGRKATAQELCARADALFDNKDYASAASNYKALLDCYPSNSQAPQSLLKLGMCYYRSGMSASAAKIFDSAKNLFPEALYYKGQAFFVRENIPDAFAYFTKIAEFFPDSELASEAQLRVADYYSKNGYEDLAESLYASIIKKFPRGAAVANACWRLGFSYYSKGRYDLAYSTFGEAYEKVPNVSVTASCLYWQAKSAEKMGMKEAAEQIYEKAALRYPNTYYGYRAADRLNMNLPRFTSVPLPVISFSYIPSDNLHWAKFCELMKARAFDSAFEEAEIFYEESAVSQDKRKARVGMASVLAAQNDYQKSIRLAEIEVHESLAAGEIEGDSSWAMAVSYPRRYGEFVDKYCEQFGVEPSLMYALIREESRFNPRGLSRTMAHGLTQIMPSTGRGIARNLGIRHYNTSRLFEPELNVKMGAYYLSQQLKRFNGDKHLALASYNGGSGNVRRWVRKNGYSDIDEFVENIPYKETRGYVKKVLESYWQYKRIYETEHAWKTKTTG
ncbi:MAG: transglycosylase SLT domain-containing protein [Candidatus Margulisiibacteriota bacterium]